MISIREKKSLQSRNSNPGRLEEKRKCFLFAKSPPPHFHDRCEARSSLPWIESDPLRGQQWLSSFQFCRPYIPFCSFSSFFAEIIILLWLQKLVFWSKHWRVNLFQINPDSMELQVATDLNKTCRKRRRYSSVSRASERSHFGATLLTWVQITRETFHLSLSKHTTA